MDSFQKEHRLFPISTPTPFPIGPVNIFLHKQDPVTLIDAGTATEEAYEALVHGLKQHKTAIADVKRVIVTHHHLDHIGLLHRIMEESGAESYGHPGIPQQKQVNYAYDERQRAPFLALMREMGVPEEVAESGLKQRDLMKPLLRPYAITHALKDNEHVGPFKAIFVPGHSATDTILINETEGYSITGDHILEIVNPNPLLRLSHTGDTRPKSLIEYRNSLRRARALELGKCFPGHGQPFDDHRKVIDGLMSRQDRRRTRVLHLVPKGGITPYEVAAALYPRRIASEFYLCLSMAAGQLECLEEQGLAVSELRGPVRYFSPAPAAVAYSSPDWQPA